MTTDQHPALIVDTGTLPTLTLVLPEDLGRDEVLQGLVQAIGQVRDDLAKRMTRFQQLVQTHHADGDEVRLALCRGQVLSSEHAASSIDESIIGVFDLWDQYEAQDPSPGHETAEDAEPREPSAEGTE
jgi:hypothetical protein